MVRIFRIALSVLLFFILFFFTLACGVRSVCSEENVGKYVNKISVEKIFGGEDKIIVSSFEDTLVEAGIPNEIVLSIINSSTSEAIVKDYMVSVINNVLNDGQINPISNDDIVNIVRGNMDYIKEYSAEQGVVITPEMEEDIIYNVEANAYKITQNIPSLNDILTPEERKSLDSNIKIVRFILGDMFKNAAVLLIIAICALLIMLSTTKFKYFFSVGIPCLLSGLIYIILCYIAEDKLRDLITSHFEVDKDVLDITTKALLEGFRDQAIIIFLVGILAVVIGVCVSILIDVFKGRKTKNEL